MKRALSVNDVINKKRYPLDFTGEWREAFGTPEKHGVWFVWGDSGNGKTSFVMQLCKELSKFGRVVYNSLEEGVSVAIQNSIVRAGLPEVHRRFRLVDGEPMDEFEERMCKRKSPEFYVIDSIQYTGLTFEDYRRFKEANPKKLIIFVSQAKSKKPDGRVATRVMFDASMKIYIEGYRAISKGRSIGPKGYYTIWKDGAERYWGKKGID
ncbi:hypothetical protein [uncultured Duncaniella sp.]|uniref:hypothetical protein n=1 Tax=uncultured Duncaniella sp. TaxID=2768039 RepID=UPI00272AB789|nr:hypothetical protein [uncultured Duncaniella sp.]